MGMPDVEHLPPDARRVVVRCVEASQAADRCAVACTRAGDAEAVRCARLCRDVADLTSTIARLMVRGSGSLPQLGQIAYGGCLTGADACAQLDREPSRVAEAALREAAEALETLASGAPPTQDGDTMATPEPNSPWVGYFEPDQTT